jgi:hypothetical protein
MVSSLSVTCYVNAHCSVCFFLLGIGDGSYMGFCFGLSYWNSMVLGIAYYWFVLDSSDGSWNVIGSSLGWYIYFFNVFSC